jgi:hypothetical protein
MRCLAPSSTRRRPIAPREPRVRRCHPLAGHSPRAGHTTTAAAAGVKERKIARVTRHKNLAVPRTHLRPETTFDGGEPVL